MSKRPNVQEILARVRAAGPGSSKQDSDSEPPAPVIDQEPPRIAPASPFPNAPATPEGSEPPISPDSRGASRRLSLQEKLAAARNRPAEAGQSAGSNPSSGAGEAERTLEATAPVPASESESSPPVASGKLLSLQEKLAAARGRPASGPANPLPKAKMESLTADRSTDRNLEVNARELLPLEEVSKPRELAELLRQSVANRAESEYRASATAERAADGAPSIASSQSRSTEQHNQVGRELLGGLVASNRARWVLGVAVLVFVVGTIGAFISSRIGSNALSDGSEMIKVGLPTEFELNSVVEVSEASQPFWVVRSTAYDGLDTIYALQGTCSGSGGLALWSPEMQTFQCERTASRYAISGLLVEGQGDGAMTRFRVVLTEDGQVAVDPSQTFLEELGEWTNPQSFIRIPSEGASGHSSADPVVRPRDEDS